MSWPSRRSCLSMLACAAALTFAAASPAFADEVFIPDDAQSGPWAPRDCDAPLHFDMSEVPSGSEISYAELSVNIGGLGSFWGLSVFEADSSGDPTGPDFGPMHGGWGQEIRFTDVTSLAQGWFDTSASNHGVLVCGDEDPVSDGELYVNYTPPSP
jgi:hypothetical protein